MRETVSELAKEMSAEDAYRYQDWLKWAAYEAALERLMNSYGAA